MDKKSTGPYQHYERPTEKRSSHDRTRRGSAGWITAIVILAVVLIALVPLVHHLASGHSENAEKVQNVQKISSSSKTKKKTAKAKSSLSSSSSSSSTSSSKKKKTKIKTKTKTYIVQSGDSLTSIAQANNMTVEQLAKLNNLKVSSNVNIGQTLKLK